MAFVCRASQTYLMTIDMFIIKPRVRASRFSCLDEKRACFSRSSRETHTPRASRGTRLSYRGSLGVSRARGAAGSPLHIYLSDPSPDVLAPFLYNPENTVTRFSLRQTKNHMCGELWCTDYRCASHARPASSHHALQGHHLSPALPRPGTPPRARVRFRHGDRGRIVLHSLRPAAALYDPRLAR